MRLKMSGAIVLAAFLLLPASPLSAQTGPKADYQAGLAAYKRGEITAALKLIGRSANAGHADSQFSLGLLYHRGQGVRKSVKEAVRWWRDAAGQGHVGAQVNLGIVFSKGVGVLQDYAESAKWNRMAAENGVAQAQLNLGLLYYRGEGVPGTPPRRRSGTRKRRRAETPKPSSTSDTSTRRESASPRIWFWPISGLPSPTRRETKKQR